MKKIINMNINENEAERVLNLVNTKLTKKITIENLMENISMSKTSPSDYWSIKLSEQNIPNIEHSQKEHFLEISIDHVLNSRTNPY